MSALKAQVMLVDDHPMIRDGMAMCINAKADMEVFAEAGSSDEALAILETKHHIDIALIDVSLKADSGLELIKRMHARIPALPVLVVSMHDEGVYAERALQAGAHGYVMKHESSETLVTAIREVLKEGFYLSKEMHAKLVNRAMTGNSGPKLLVDSLTPSEFEVLHLIGSGHSNQEIAKLLNRSIHTIETHRFNIRGKLGLKDAAELVRYAIRWISEEH